MSKLEKYSKKIKRRHGEEIIKNFEGVSDYRVLKRFYVNGGDPLWEKKKKSIEEQINSIINENPSNLITFIYNKKANEEEIKKMMTDSEIIKKIINNNPGAYFDVMNTLGLNNDGDVVNFFQENGANGKTLVDALQRIPDREIIVKKIIDVCPQAVAVKDDRENTPLHLAIKNKNNDDIIEHMIEKCPEAVAVKDDRKNTPLHLAIKNTIAIENENNDEKKTPYDIIEHMIEKCPEAVAVKNSNADTPLHLALQGKKKLTECVINKYISKLPQTIDEKFENITNGCKNAFGIRNAKGETPLHLAVSNNLGVDIIQNIINGCTKALDVNNEQKETPYYIAEIKELGEVIEIMDNYKSQSTNR